MASSGGRGGQLVVERALLAEELDAPLLHQCVGVAVVRVEVGSVVVLELLPQLAAGTIGRLPEACASCGGACRGCRWPGRRASRPAPARPCRGRSRSAGSSSSTPACARCRRRPCTRRRPPPCARTPPGRATRRGCGPPACPNRSRVSSLVSTSSASVAVKCSSAAVAARLALAGAIRSRSSRPERVIRSTMLGGVAELGEAVVEGPVLAAVHGLLADEAVDLALQLRVGDLVAEVAHRADEEVLAVGEHGRQAGGHVAGDEVAVGGEVLRQDPAATPRRRCGGWGPCGRGCWSASSVTDRSMN